MRRVLIFVYVLLLLLPAVSTAQEKERWERVYTLEDATIAMNSTKVEFGDNGMARVQFRWRWEKPQSLDGSPETKYRARIEVIEFNCSRRRYRLAGFTLFDGKGKPLLSKEAEPTEEWKFVKAGGMMEKLLGPACRMMEEKKRHH